MCRAGKKVIVSLQGTHENEGNIFSINYLNKKTWSPLKTYSKKNLSKILCPEIVIKRYICNVESYALLTSKCSRQKCKIKRS